MPIGRLRSRTAISKKMDKDSISYWSNKIILFMFCRVNFFCLKHTRSAANNNKRLYYTWLGCCLRVAVNRPAKQEANQRRDGEKKVIFVMCGISLSHRLLKILFGNYN